MNQIFNTHLQYASRIKPNLPKQNNLPLTIGRPRFPAPPAIAKPQRVAFVHRPGNRDVVEECRIASSTISRRATSAGAADDLFEVRVSSKSPLPCAVLLARPGATPHRSVRLLLCGIYRMNFVARTVIKRLDVSLRTEVPGVSAC